jgi:hypothetical protein
MNELSINEMDPELRESIIDLRHYVCVTRAIERDGKPVMLIAPFSSKGRTVLDTDKKLSYTAEDIRVLHSVMYLWREDSDWHLQLASKHHQIHTFVSKNDALKLAKQEIEEYWIKHNVPGA